MVAPSRRRRSAVRLFVSGDFGEVSPPTGSAIVVDVSGAQVSGAFPLFDGTVPRDRRGRARRVGGGRRVPEGERPVPFELRASPARSHRRSALPHHDRRRDPPRANRPRARVSRRRFHDDQWQSPAGARRAGRRDGHALVMGKCLRSRRGRVHRHASRSAQPLDLVDGRVRVGRRRGRRGSPSPPGPDGSGASRQAPGTGSSSASLSSRPSRPRPRASTWAARATAPAVGR